MFPNPASTNINVVLEGKPGENILVQLFDLSGRLLQSQKMTLHAFNETCIFKVNEMQSQTCVVKIIKGDKVTSSMIVVQH